ncbi:MAG TPA: SDR family oxidoreductase [Polyangiaceae bacterium]|nr:SDR family oxidoreductase [Polyangiaceae bacterium]
MTRLFDQQWVLVTGASSGLGVEMARRLAERGAHLVLTARSRDRLEELAADIGRVNGFETRVIVADLGQPGGAAELVAATRRLGVPIAHLVNNAGFGSAGAFVDLDAERESSMVELNVGAVVRLTRALLGPMITARQGGVLNVASTAAFQPVPYMATYGATKAFVVSFTLALASELEGSGVRAMALCPGPVYTGFQTAAGIERPALPLAVLSPTRTVVRALEAYERGERIYTPGLFNGVQTAAARMLPTSLSTWLAKRTMHRLGRVRQLKGA